MTEQKTPAFSKELNILAALLGGDPKSEAAQQLIGAICSKSEEELLASWVHGDAQKARTAFALIRKGVEEDASGSVSLSEDFRRLFVGPKRLPVSPWASVWLDGEYTLWGDSTLQLRKWMQEHGISFECKKEPEDHIVYELLLCAYVAKYTPESLCVLLQTFLKPWAPPYLNELQQAAHSSFYQGVALLTQTTLKAGYASFV